MSIAKIEFEGDTWSQIQCDNCKEVLENHDGHNLMPDDLAIENMANEYEWERVDKKHYCQECYHYDDNGNIIIDESRKE